MPRSGHKGESMLETVLWVVFLIMFGAVGVIATIVAIFMLSEEK
jgi:phage shock protein PspC (stress-responsive transcriptional regulator)